MLALDGGGIHGMLTLEILAEIERSSRRRPIGERRSGYTT
jgi:hypothetical protein